MPGGHPVLIVGNDPARVEADLVAGRLACPPCGGELGPWGHAQWRALRRRDGHEEPMRPRRARCRMCKVTQVLLGDVALLRRRDDAETIGAAIEAKASGLCHRRIAEALGRHEDTVRGWLRAFVRAAEAIRVHFTRWAVALDPLLGPIEPTGGPLGDALAAIGTATRAAVLAFGPRPVWSAVSAMSGGALLCNASVPFPAVP